MDLSKQTAIVIPPALLAAVVSIWGLDALCSSDRDSDRIPGIRRVEPEG